MEWLPSHHDFRSALREARSLDDSATRASRLAALAGYRLTYLELLQLAQAASELDVAATSLRPLCIAVLSTGTVDHLAPAFAVAGLRRGLHVTTHVGGFAQFRQELLDTAAPLHAVRPDYVVFSLSARELLAGAALAETTGEAEERAARFVDDLRQLWSLACERLGAVVIQQSLIDTTPPLFGSFDRFVPGAPARLVARANELAAVAAVDAGILWLDLDRSIARDGLDAWFDLARWLQAKMEIAPAAAAHYGELVVRLVEAHRGRSRKCLVLDLDDTLWGGTIGDDGPEGIVIGPGSARGEAHHELQHHARLLAQRGVILAVCSKNDPALAETVFEEHPAMALRRQDFAAFIANWDDKATNLQRIAAQLNIGLDSLVFVDNSPAERARIRESLPMVAVPELPDDPAGYVRCLSGAGYFEAVSFTAEDGQRAHGYVADAQRSELRAAAQSMEAYLRGLDMRLHAGVVRPLDLPRAAQLIAKTNQFNATGRRYGPEDIRALAADGGIALQFRLADRFGDNGLVSVMLLVPLAAESGAYELGNWVMSCRVFGRQLEAEALNVAVEQLRARSARTLYVQYVPTPRNGPMADLFSRLGFSRAPCVDPETTATRWLLEIEAYRPSATCIARMDA